MQITDNEDLDFQLLPAGMKLTVGDNDFKTGLKDLKTALEQLTVNTPNGPSSVPMNVSAITQALQKNVRLSAIKPNVI